MKSVFKKIALSLLVSSSFVAQAQTLVKMHHDMSVDSAQHDGALLFKELVEKNSQNQIKVDIYPNNALGNDVEVAQQMQFGAVHAAPIPTAKLSGFNPTLQFVDLPFLFPNREVAYQFMDGEVGQEILAGLRKSGFEPAMFWESGFKQFTCNHAVKSPADFAGRKVRVMESPMLIAQFKAMDARPIPISFTETYTSLQQGVVECQENPLVSITNMKFYEVQDYLMLSNHGYLGTAFIFSKMWFDGLPKAQQQILKQAAVEAGHYQRVQSEKREQAYLQTISNAGGTDIIELTASQMAEFKQSMEPVYEKFGKQLGQKMMDKVLAEVDQLNAK
ncbi:TRAP transporter substrate-binding protein [Catenovulum sp. 2E275]|uniref:TRAP transporter substrate-binding protein n=1 Tax=Catenovulum sp. 2E275 TaxID=2980497 RepID=UPI0021D05ED6|nr:TRAP transporter substrate-binding protein [Catenovulum sp. 2E275]MCU4677407.1 TRAP transporter substrate-binding protein [Catenovulum sp. 2E275]